MLKSKDIIKGTIFEITKENSNMFFENKKELMKIGEHYECLTNVRKNGSALEVKLRQINGNKSGDIFWVFINNGIKIVSSPEVIKVNLEQLIPPEEFKLNDNEEFVVVKKDCPDLVLRTLNHQWHKEFGTTDKNDIDDGAFVFDTKSGKRKKFKNKATLLGFLNANTGMLEMYYYYANFKENPKIQKEQEYNLYDLDSVPDWVNEYLGNVQDIDLFSNSLNFLELRKYNMETRKISEVAVNFDFSQYIIKFKKTMQSIRIYGEAVTAVINKIMENNEINIYPYILSIKNNYNNYMDKSQIPKEKDNQLDDAFKKLNLKNKDFIHYNNNGFVSIAFKTEEQINQFLNVYKNEDKIISTIDTADIINKIELGNHNVLKKKMK